MKKPDELPAHRPTPSLIQSLKLVMSSFVGLRSRGGYEQDIATVNPVHIIVAGLVGVFVFVGGLIVLATWVVGK